MAIDNVNFNANNAMSRATTAAGNKLAEMDKLIEKLATADSKASAQIQAELTKLGRIYDLIIRVMEQIKQSWQAYTQVR